MIGVSSDSAVLVTAMFSSSFIRARIARVYYARIRVGDEKAALSELPYSLNLGDDVLADLGVAFLVAVSRTPLLQALEADQEVLEPFAVGSVAPQVFKQVADLDKDRKLTGQVAEAS